MWIAEKSKSQREFSDQRKVGERKGMLSLKEGGGRRREQ